MDLIDRDFSRNEFDETGCLDTAIGDELSLFAWMWMISSFNGTFITGKDASFSCNYRFTFHDIRVEGEILVESDHLQSNKLFSLIC